MQERIGHGAADDQLVDTLYEVFENRNLCRDLGAADHRTDRPDRIAERLIQSRNLRLHPRARERRQQSRDTLSRSMGAMRNGKRVVHENIAQTSKRSREAGIVAFFTWMKP